MNWRISIILILWVILGCKKTDQIPSNSNKNSYVIEADELKTLVNHPNIKIIDFRKKRTYENEHILGALNIWRTDIENATYPYSGMMPSKPQLEKLFGTLGIKNTDTLIAYDDKGLCEAARLWWILQNYDFKNIKMLHGGIKTWKARGGKVSDKIPAIEETIFTFTENPSMPYYASKENVQLALKENTLILDTRTEDEFSGKRQKKGAARSGRIPGSIHIDWTEAIYYNEDKHIKSLQDLDIIYRKLNASKDDPIIVYCHSGVRSAHTFFVLTQLLGYKNVKNYDGSWTEWSYFNNLPIERDSTTLITN